MVIPQLLGGERAELEMFSALFTSSEMMKGVMFQPPSTDPAQGRGKMRLPGEAGKIYLLKEAFELLEPEAASALAGVIDALRGLFGKRLSIISMREIDKESTDGLLETWLATYNKVSRCEIWSSLGAMLEANQVQLGPTIAANFQLAKKTDRSDLSESITRREAYFGRLNFFLSQFSLICIPTAPRPAPIKGSIGVNRDKEDYFVRAMSLTSVAGIGRLPQISMPVADVNGAPIGLSLLAGHRQDAYLLSMVKQIAESLNIG
jgi:amidase